MAQDRYNTKCALEFAGKPTREEFMEKLALGGITDDDFPGTPNGLWENFNSKFSLAAAYGDDGVLDPGAPLYCVCDTLGGSMNVAQGKVDTSPSWGMESSLGVGNKVVRADSRVVTLDVATLGAPSIDEPARNSGPAVPPLVFPPGMVVDDLDVGAAPSIDRGRKDSGIEARSSRTAHDDLAAMLDADEDELEVLEWDELDLTDDEVKTVEIRLREDAITKEAFTAAYNGALGLGAGASDEVINAAYERFEFMHRNAEYQRAHAKGGVQPRSEVVFDVTENDGISIATLEVANITVEQRRDADGGVVGNTTCRVGDAEAVDLSAEDLAAAAAYAALVDAEAAVVASALQPQPGVVVGAEVDMDADTGPDAAVVQPAVAAPTDLMLADEDVDIKLAFESGRPTYKEFEHAYGPKYRDAYKGGKFLDESTVKQVYQSFMVQCDLLGVSEEESVVYESGLGEGGDGRDYDYVHVSAGDRHCRLDLENDDACRVKTADGLYELRDDTKYTLGEGNEFSVVAESDIQSFAERLEAKRTAGEYGVDAADKEIGGPEGEPAGHEAADTGGRGADEAVQPQLEATVPEVDGVATDKETGVPEVRPKGEAVVSDTVVEAAAGQAGPGDDVHTDLMEGGEDVDVSLSFDHRPNYNEFRAGYAQQFAEAWGEAPAENVLQQAYIELVVQCDLLEVGARDPVVYKTGADKSDDDEYDYAHVSSGEKHSRVDLKKHSCRVSTPDENYELRGHKKYTPGDDGDFTVETGADLESMSDRYRTLEAQLDYDAEVASVVSSVGDPVMPEAPGPLGTLGGDGRHSVAFTASSTSSTFSTPPAPASVVGNISAASADRALTVAEVLEKLEKNAANKKTDREQTKDQRTQRQEDRAEARRERQEKRRLDKEKKGAKADLIEEYQDDRNDIEENAGAALKWGGGVGGTLLLVGVAFPPAAAAGLVILAMTGLYEAKQGYNWAESRAEQWGAARDLDADYADKRAEHREDVAERRAQREEERAASKEVQRVAVDSEKFKVDVEKLVHQLEEQGLDPNDYKVSFDKNGRLSAISEAAEVAASVEPAATGDARAMAANLEVGGSTVTPTVAAELTTATGVKR